MCVCWDYNRVRNLSYLQGGSPDYKSSSPQCIWGKELIVFPQHNTAKLDVWLLLHERAWTSLKLIVFILEIDLTSSHFSRSYSKYLMTHRWQIRFLSFSFCILRSVTMEDQVHIETCPLWEITAATPTNQASATRELYAWWLVHDLMWIDFVMDLMTLWCIWWLCDEYHDFCDGFDDFVIDLMTLWWVSWLCDELCIYVIYEMSLYKSVFCFF
jgi:hypothetical protein